MTIFKVPIFGYLLNLKHLYYYALKNILAIHQYFVFWFLNLYGEVKNTKLKILPTNSSQLMRLRWSFTCMYNGVCVTVTNDVPKVRRFTGSAMFHSSALWSEERKHAVNVTKTYRRLEDLSYCTKLLPWHYVLLYCGPIPIVLQGTIQF